MQLVRPGRAGHVLDRGQRVALAIAEAGGAGLQGHLHPRGRARIIRRVGPVAAEQPVRPRPADQRVVAQPAGEDVGARQPVERVVAVGADPVVGPRPWRGARPGTRRCAVRVGADVQIGCGRAEHDGAAVGRDPRLEGVAVARRAVGCHGQARHRAGLHVLDEDVVGRAAVARHQVRRLAREHDVAAVGRDVGTVRRPGGLGPGAGRGDADRGVGLQVAQEDVDDPVGVVRHQVGGGTLEHDIAAVAGDRSLVRIVVRLGPVRSDRDALGGPGREVADEDVVVAVGVAGNEIVGTADEGDALAVIETRPLSVHAVALGFVIADGNAGRGPVCRSRMKMSTWPLVSPSTILVALLLNTT